MFTNRICLNVNPFVGKESIIIVCFDINLWTIPKALSDVACIFEWINFGLIRECWHQQNPIIISPYMIHYKGLICQIEIPESLTMRILKKKNRENLCHANKKIIFSIRYCTHALLSTMKNGLKLVQDKMVWNLDARKTLVSSGGANVQWKCISIQSHTLTACINYKYHFAYMHAWEYSTRLYILNAVLSRFLLWFLSQSLALLHFLLISYCSAQSFSQLRCHTYECNIILL